MASLKDMLDVSWIPAQDAKEIVRQRGPGGRLYLAQLLRTSSLSQLKLDHLIQQGMVTVHFEDDSNWEENQSLLSDTSSMREEMEAMCEENRLLRKAMEWQTRLQQDVLASVVGEMATWERSDHIPVMRQQDDPVQQTAVKEQLPVGKVLPARSEFEGANESLAWDSMGQLISLGSVPWSTNPFVTYMQIQAPVSDPLTRSSGWIDVRCVLTGRADTGGQEGRSAHVSSIVDQRPALMETCVDHNVWAELQLQRPQAAGEPGCEVVTHGCVANYCQASTSLFHVPNGFAY